MRRSQIFLFIVGSLFTALAILFIFFPRPSFSEVERRELSVFPEFTMEALKSGTFTRDVSTWFSDTEPFRDRFLSTAMTLKSYMALKTGGDGDIAFHATGASIDDGEAMELDEGFTGQEPADTLGAMSSGAKPLEIAEYDGHAVPEGAAKLASSGVIVIGSGADTRALMAFGSSAKAGVKYAEAANLYKSVLGTDVSVYCMVVPLASEFYTPEKARKLTNPQLPVIRNIYSHLDAGVIPVDAYSALASHADEPIYLRTDHHWAPLGAYYAAEALAKAAGVPFLPLEAYDEHTVHNFVGTMYGFSKDIAIKNAPEDFVYYTPRDVDYTTTAVTINLDSNFRPVGESKPYKTKFFHRFSDGSSSAYLTFMGGDYNQTVVRTGLGNGRRLVIIKDSYGNAVPGFLFGSFEEIHVLDHRYFRHDVASYVRDNRITDLVMINNIFNASSSGVASRYRYILTRSTPVPAPTPKDTVAAKPEEVKPDTVAAPKPAVEPETSPEEIEKEEKAVKPDSLTEVSQMEVGILGCGFEVDEQ